METKTILQKIIDRQDLTEIGAFGVTQTMLKGSFTPSQIGGFLVGLAEKGESVDEIVGFIKAMRQYMVRVEGITDAIDVCGTGGDGAKTFNISTAVAFVVAGSGIKVAKHGNRAASSKCGSADVLEALGVNINLNQKQASEVLHSVGMVFLFAPIFHPAFKNVALVRKELGIKTIFNYIGPFANPACVKRQLIGVPNPKLAEKLAEVAKQLDYEHLLIVTSEDGLDEISIFGKTIGFEVKGKEVKKKIIDPKDLGNVIYRMRSFGMYHTVRPFAYAQDDSSLIGGAAKNNARIIKNILSGEKGPKREIVALNSAYALYIAGKVQNPKQGITLAEESIDSGSAKQALDSLVKETQKYA